MFSILFFSAESAKKGGDTSKPPSAKGSKPGSAKDISKKGGAKSKESKLDLSDSKWQNLYEIHKPQLAVWQISVSSTHNFLELNILYQFRFTFRGLDVVSVFVCECICVCM